MVDIHAHILPGVDDGSDDMETSLQMARMAAESGVTDMVATPHANQPGRFENYAGEALTARFDALCEQLESERLALRLHRGMEVYGTPDTAKLLHRGKLTTLSQSRYFLVEFGFSDNPYYMDQVLRSLHAEGVTPILAHPERYRALQTVPNILFDWVLGGTVLQINKGSLSGYFGRDAFALAVQMLQHDLVSVVASDAHGVHRRTTVLAEAFDWVSEQFGERRAVRLFTDNPSRVLRDQSLRECDPIPFSDRY